MNKFKKGRLPKTAIDISHNSALWHVAASTPADVTFSSSSLQATGNIHPGKNVQRVDDGRIKGVYQYRTTTDNDRQLALLIETHGQELTINENTNKIFRLIMYKSQQDQDDLNLTIEVGEYSDLAGISRSQARRQLITAIKQLVGLSVARDNSQELTRSQLRSEPLYEKTVLFTDGICRKGNAVFTLNQKFRKNINTYAMPMVIDKAEFKLKGNAYMIYIYLYNNLQINFHNATNRQNKVKLGTLLKHTKIPTHAQVAAGDRNYNLRIIKPMQKAMKQLKDNDCIRKYQYVTTDGKICKKVSELPLNDFDNCFLEVTSWNPRLNASQIAKVRGNADKYRKD